MVQLSGYYLDFLFRHYHSQISLQKPAVSWEFRAFTQFLQANGRTAFHVRFYVHYLIVVLFNSFP